MNDFSRFFVTRSNSNKTEIRAYLFGLMQAKRDAKNLERMEEDAQPDTAWQRLKVRDCDQDWVEVSYLAERIWVVEGDLQKCWWLLAWENPDERTNNGMELKAPRRHFALSKYGITTWHWS